MDPLERIANNSKHYDFYYFMVNRSTGFNGRIFDFSSEPTVATPPPPPEEEEEVEAYNPLSSAKAKKEKDQGLQLPDEELEGFSDDPTLTKVVDRRWFEKNKHIYPASLWEEFDPTKDYSKGLRKDTVGNTLFFS
jgi:protein FAM50